MSKERLEEIEEAYRLSHKHIGAYVSSEGIEWLIKYAKEQAERVQELEEEYEKELKNTIRKKNRHLRKKDKRIKKLEWDNMIHRRGHSDLYATLYSLRKELEEKGIETEF